MLHLYLINYMQQSTSYFYTHTLETTLSLTSSNFRFIFRYFPCAISRKGFSTKTCIITSANKYSTEKLKDVETIMMQTLRTTQDHGGINING